MPNFDTLPIRIISWFPSTCSTSRRSFSVSSRYGASHENWRSCADTTVMSFARTPSTPSAYTSGCGSGGRAAAPAPAMPAAPASSGMYPGERARCGMWPQPAGPGGTVAAGCSAPGAMAGGRGWYPWPWPYGIMWPPACAGCGWDTTMPRMCGGMPILGSIMGRGIICPPYMPRGGTPAMPGPQYGALIPCAGWPRPPIDGCAPRGGPDIIPAWGMPRSGAPAAPCIVAPRGARPAEPLPYAAAPPLWRLPPDSGAAAWPPLCISPRGHADTRDQRVLPRASAAEHQQLPLAPSRNAQQPRHCAGGVTGEVMATPPAAPHR